MICNSLLVLALNLVCNLAGIDEFVHAGKVLAAAAIDLLTDPSLLEAAKAEFRKQTAEGYTCPIPADAVPVVPD